MYQNIPAFPIKMYRVTGYEVRQGKMLSEIRLKSFLKLKYNNYIPFDCFLIILTCLTGSETYVQIGNSDPNIWFSLLLLVTVSSRTTSISFN
jgi:hypothetical protein